MMPALYFCKHDLLVLLPNLVLLFVRASIRQRQPLVLRYLLARTATSRSFA